ncbi:haloacid dehalogenase [Aquibium carbonis]|uniref:Haloacid dehalogenase n=1 Tax=Aquibium carbonis TaxID=2495581 RepID=A0A429YU13_9HYPH|nr:haloacid dehalogenase [Aquibium carbonis]
MRIADIAQAPVEGCEAIFCDLDGCLVSGGHVYPNVRSFVASHADRLWIVSNNSSDTAETLSRRMATIGLAIDPRRILLAGEQAVHRIAAARPGAALSLYAEPPIRNLARSLGLRTESRKPDIVLLARDGDFTVRDLGRLIDEVHDGAALVVTNVDTVHPDDRGRPVPETGAIVAAIRACVPSVGFTSIGKPAPDLVELGLRLSGAARAACVFIGDNAGTDGVAAAAAGVRFIHLRRMTANGPPAAGALAMPDAAAAGGSI